MSEIYAYICTKQTADPYVPSTSRDLTMLSRDVSDGFQALVGGYLRVGQISFFPIQKAVPYHLLCDGHEEPQGRFPELYAYLGNSQGTPVDPDNFVLPDYIGSLTPAASADPEVIEGGTVTSETPSPGTGDSGGSIDPPKDSGGRFPRLPGEVWP
jgi:hypothetical protein